MSARPATVASGLKDLYVDLASVQQLTGWSERHVQRQIRVGQLKARPTGKLSKNGKPENEFLLSSLPPLAQLHHASQLARQTPIEAPKEESAVTPDAPRERCDIPDRFRPKVERKLSLVEEVFSLCKRSSREKQVPIDGVIVASLEDALEFVATKHGAPLSSLRRWYYRFRKRGEVGLAPKLREDEGKSRFFEDHPRAALFVQAMSLRESATPSAICDELRKRWSEAEIGETGEPPSRDTIERYLKRAIPMPAALLARDGKEAYVSKCSLSIIRTPVPVMHTFVSDHRVHDVFVRNTVWSELKPNALYRPWMTAVYDWGSRKIMGVVWAPNPSSRTINSAIRMAIAHAGGFPRNFYWDNGKDYRAVGRILLSPELSALLESQSVQFSGEGCASVERVVKHALPKRPRGKPIESWFAFWAKRFDTYWRPAYAGNKPDRCPADCREAQRQHAQFLAGKRADTHIPTDEEFMVLAAEWADEYNNRPLNSLDGRTPNQVFDEQWPEANRRAPDPRMLARLFWESEERVLMAGGCVKMDSMRYRPKPEYLRVLSAMQEQRVKVLRDPYNLGGGIVVHVESGEFLGEIILQRPIAQSDDPITRDAVKAAMREQRSTQKQFQNYIDAVYSLARAKGFKTQREDLRERALGTGTYGGAINAIAPGAGAARLSAAPHRASLPALAPAFVSDAVNDGFDISKVETED